MMLMMMDDDDDFKVLVSQLVAVVLLCIGQVKTKIEIKTNHRASLLNHRKPHILDDDFFQQHPIFKGAFNFGFSVQTGW